MSEPSSKKMKIPECNEDSCQISIDNSEYILKTLKHLYKDKELCDVFLTVGDKVHAAHRLILCASSNVFQVMLTNPKWREWHESKIVLQEQPNCEEIFDQFLEYFYTGHIIINHRNVLAILTLADKYIVKSLTSLCVDYMCKNIAHAATYNQLFSWLQYTTTCSFHQVADLCLQHIKWNLEAVANSPDFTNFDLNLFCHLLKQNDLVIHNEVVLYNCTTQWLKLQEIRLKQQDFTDAEIAETMEHMVGEVMKYIRFPMMNPKEIARLLPSPLIKEYHHILLDHMAKGIIFQSGKIEENDQFWFSDEGKLITKPRLYTYDSFSTSLIVENVNNLPSYHVSTYVFSTHTSLVDCDTDRISEWVVDLYPKGVWFKKCCLIVWQGTVEVPESVKTTVRMSLTCREPLVASLRVRVTMLLYGVQNDSEFIMDVVHREHRFTATDSMMVVDDIMPFDELNRNLVETGAKKERSSYLTGPNRDQLKINIIITPIT